VGNAQAGDNQSQQLIKVLREMTDGEAHQAITDFLHSLNIRIDANRAEGEVIERLLHKIREDQQGPKLQVALDFMQRLGELTGDPAQTLSRARALAADFKLDGGALDALGRTLDCLAEYGDISGDIELDFGLIFELHCPTDSGEMIQLCGGGRYDNLVSILGGGETTPALGFAYGIERIASVLEAGANEPPADGDVCVIPVAEADFAAAFTIAEELRARNIATEVSIDGRNLGRSLKRADRRGAALVIIVGEAERAAQMAILRDMRGRQERRVPLAELAGTVAERLNAAEY
ncbi:MAG: ATP phosphoribosyltransferase regulatory subunit, partial [Anaerolineae bacterium]|nr:ATP phosphoribosyltransferase regulatory subunit [Anaerolineae bacterium]